ncbi:hypothetical protein DFJ63DRAFT_333535 [Scheffersomyces coipomensis]|uniref:uncharacterized protein n=1 Tax=Scheffersomyces coipomensis TaxID=1788519 RepID=UPI00315C5871
MSDAPLSIPVQARRKKLTSPVDILKSYITPKFIKDLKFGFFTFLFMCVMLFHYAFIMKTWLYDPYMALYKLAAHFVFFFAHISFWGYILYQYSYKVVYREDIEQEKAELEALRKQKTQ